MKLQGYLTISSMGLLLTSRAASGFVSRSLNRNRVYLIPSRVFSSQATTTTKSDRLFPEEVNIIYDSKCNVCKLEIDFLRRRDEKLAQKRAAGEGLPPQTKLKFTDLESGNYDAKDPANGGVTYETGMTSMHAVTAEGKLISGVPVFRLAYEQVNLGWLFKVTEIPLVKKIADKVYDIFAKYRTQLTRGATVESLVEAYREKKALQEQQRADDCEVCATDGKPTK